jgi:hypothetical protein
MKLISQVFDDLGGEVLTAMTGSARQMKTTLLTRKRVATRHAKKICRQEKEKGQRGARWEEGRVWTHASNLEGAKGHVQKDRLWRGKRPTDSAYIRKRPD